MPNNDWIHLLNLLRYLAAIVEDGDYKNDWITHLPLHWHLTVREIGNILATILELVEKIG